MKEDKLKSIITKLIAIIRDLNLTKNKPDVKMDNMLTELQLEVRRL